MDPDCTTLFAFQRPPNSAPGKHKDPKMRSVIGIDAAWTARNPSGVAVALDDGNGWRLLAAAPSYAAFHALAGGEPTTEFEAERLIADATRLAEVAPSLVAIDMPLMADLITSRRISDNAISSAYGARGAGTHSPSALRPGPLAVDMLAALTRRGYPLLCQGPVAAPGTLEVYPHPALIELTSAARRLPYKALNRAKYWPHLTAAERRDALLTQWRAIVAALDAVLPGSATSLPPPPATAPLRVLKAYEDTLDAVVCAWVATTALDGRARPYGDTKSAIWVPLPSA
jgi:predicted RNase H-like nuclease